MKITFLGGADEVGASCTLVEIAGKKLLIDAGIRISPKTSRGLRDDQLPHLDFLTEVGGPDVILVTHAHTDHTGALPLVTETYPKVPVYGTQPTIDLTRILQKDAGRLMGSRYEAEGELPLYDTVAIERLFDNFRAVPTHQAITLGEGLQVTYYPSGHIAGACMLVLESSEGVLVMSGDLSLSPQRTVVSAETPRIHADALVLESTYGSRGHANRKAEELRLIETLKRITDAGGKALIPAFAIGRSQEIIQIIHAYRDQISAPVYVDGMVRAVCDAYSGFKQILPKNTVRAAGDEGLFFRQNVHPVRSRDQREDIARKNEPMIVVASSGMLTGGASVVYASHFASDERNAILLTGYQDEESPGRFLQNVMRQRQRGDTPTLRLGDKSVPLRCQVDTYSLSAHADGNELVSIAEALDAQRVFLVHGDGGNRESLWESLSQRKRMVSRPRVGQTKMVARRRRPMATGVAEAEAEDSIEGVDLEQLWKTLLTHAGEMFTTRELAQVWFGDVDRDAEMRDVLEDDDTYFAQHWREKHRFAVRTPAQVKRAVQGRHFIRTTPELPGQLAVMRNSNNQPRLAVVTSAEGNNFEAIVQGAKGRNYPAHALLWALGPWTGYDEPSSADDDPSTIKDQLAMLTERAEMLSGQLLPRGRRQQLLEAGGNIVPETLLPDPLPQGVDMQLALTAVVWALAADGADYEDGVLRIQRVLRAQGPVEQNEARDLALKAFPADARLRRVGVQAARKQLQLYFDFPSTAEQRYADEMEALIVETGWDIFVVRKTNQQALTEAVREVLPEGASIAKGPSLYMDKREVGAAIGGVEGDGLRAIERAYEDLTGYRLRLTAAKGGAPVRIIKSNGGAAETQMEINAAYAHIREQLEGTGLIKTGLKGGDIVLTFISPQVGARYQEQFDRLARETGYGLRLHNHPIQNEIMAAARRLVTEAGWIVEKGPGVHPNRGEVAFKLVDSPDAAEVERVSAQLEVETGYRLVLG